jgi:hypothetical protein
MEKQCSECMYWSESQPQADNPQADWAICYNVLNEKRETLRGECCSNYYPRPTRESITVWVEDCTDCICYAFRNEFEEGREYPMTCQKRIDVLDNGDFNVCKETSEIDWEC